MPSRLLLPVIEDGDAPSGLPPCPGLRGEPCRDYQPLANREAALGSGGGPSGDEYLPQAGRKCKAKAKKKRAKGKAKGKTAAKKKKHKKKRCAKKKRKRKKGKGKRR